MDFPRVLANEKVLSRPSLKRLRLTSKKLNRLSKRKKKSFGKKHVTEFKDLPIDLMEEVLSRVPVTSLRRVRSTCKTWNTLSTSMSFVEKHLAFEKKFNSVVMEMDYKIYLVSINFLEEQDSYIIKPRGKLIDLDHSDQINVSQIYHCNGLLLCVCGFDQSKVVVWNHYSGQTRWIELTPSVHRLSYYSYALGYDRSTKSHKILRFLDAHQVDFNIYDLNSGSWRVLDSCSTTRNWKIDVFPHRGVSLKGNTYWFAREGGDFVLVCFDYTTETFGPPLPLPQQLDGTYDTLILSTVRDEQLVVLFQEWDTSFVQIFITSKIEQNAISWSNTVFLQIQVNMRQLPDIRPSFGSRSSFFIDEDKKVAVVFYKDRGPVKNTKNTRYTAYILGVDGSMKQLDLGQSSHESCSSLVLPYAPTLLHLN